MGVGDFPWVPHILAIKVALHSIAQLEVEALCTFGVVLPEAIPTIPVIISNTFFFVYSFVESIPIGGKNFFVLYV
jgi:hypothetical protein